MTDQNDQNNAPQQSPSPEPTPGDHPTPGDGPTTAAHAAPMPSTESGTPLAAPGQTPAGELGAPDIGSTITGAATVAPEKPDPHGWWWGTGRRKSARARVRIKPGSGEIKIQISRGKFKTVQEYFTELRDQNDVVAPLKVTKTEGEMDIIARLDGGGYMGQAQALRLGVARALKKYDPALEGVLREHGYLTRDAREVERKKYGQPGARRSFQFSKR